MIGVRAKGFGGEATTVAAGLENFASQNGGKQNQERAQHPL